MTDSTTHGSFHTAPPGWTAVYQGGLTDTRVPVAGFVYGPDAADESEGRTVVCDPQTGTPHRSPGVRTPERTPTHPRRGRPAGQALRARQPVHRPDLDRQLPRQHRALRREDRIGRRRHPAADVAGPDHRSGYRTGLRTCRQHRGPDAVLASGPRHVPAERSRAASCFASLVGLHLGGVSCMGWAGPAVLYGRSSGAPCPEIGERDFGHPGVSGAPLGGKNGRLQIGPAVYRALASGCRQLASGAWPGVR
jgi:hypothetical protein